MGAILLENYNIKRADYKFVVGPFVFYKTEILTLNLRLQTIH